MGKVDLEKLSIEEQKELVAQVKRNEKAQKEADKKNKKALKELKADFVLRHIDSYITRRTDLEKLIEVLFEDHKPIRDMQDEVYGKTDQDTWTSTLSDGSAGIKIGYNVSISYDGTEGAGVQKIKEFLSTLSGDADSTRKLTLAVNTLLRPNSEGKLNPAKIVELSKLKEEYNSPVFDEGLQIIFDAQIRNRNSMFVSGWKFVENENGQTRKVEFRFTV